TRDKKCLLKIQAADSARRIKCPRVGPVLFQYPPPCGELFLRAWLTARCRGNFSSGTVAPFCREKIHRRTQDRHATGRCAQKLPQHPDARPAIPATVQSQGKMSASGQSFNHGKRRSQKGNIL